MFRTDAPLRRREGAATRFAAWQKLSAIALFAAVASIAASGCSSSDSTTDASVTTSSAAKLSGLQEYSSVQELADDLASHGHPCEGLTPEKGAYYPVESGRCTINGDVTLLAIYASDAQVDAQLKEFDLLKEAGAEFGELAGKNWSINCGTRLRCEDLQADMGGRIVASAPR